MTIARWLCAVLIALSASSCAKRHRPPAAPTQGNVAPEPPPQRGVCFVPRDPNAYAYPVRQHDWLSVLTRLELGRGCSLRSRDSYSGQRGAAIVPDPQQGEQRPSGPRACPIPPSSRLRYLLASRPRSSDG